MNEWESQEWVLLLTSIVFPLIGAIYINLKGRIDQIENEYKAAILDVNVNLRHRIEGINTMLFDTLTKDRAHSVDQTQKAMETLANMLKRAGVEELERRSG